MSASFGLFDDAEFEKTLKKEFLCEARELLDDVEPSFLSYEKNPSSDHDMAQIFRLVHTFKGSAGVAGFKGLAAFAHNFETLLSRLRNREMEASETVVEILLGGNDALKGYVTALEADHAAIYDTSAMDAQILQLLSSGAAPSRPTAAATVDLKTLTSSKPQPFVGTVRPRILIADDEPTLRECIASILSSEGYDVVEAENGLEALNIVKADPTIKLLLTDQSMPIMKGEELVEKLRDAQIKIPVIVVTGMADHSAAVKFIRSGVYLYLSKPIDASDLILAVGNALRAGELAETLTKALAFTFRNYLRLRRLEADPEKQKCSSCASDSEFSESLKSMGEIISSVLRKA
ncbi:MAG: response regulator [Proteobacteria bacterium]|nr:MAG: response regulator [Pseudomonadota bacterium]